MECKFVVGQKVTPIGDNWNDPEPGYSFPRLGTVYTIRAIELRYGVIGLLLVELQNPKCAYVAGIFERAFSAEAFRPVDERKTDISIFTELLTPAGQKKRILEDAHV